MGDQTLAVQGDLSTNPPKRGPPALNITSFLPFAKPAATVSPVRRKPLPPSARTSLTPSQSAPSLGVSKTPQSQLSPDLVVRDLDQ